MTPTEPDDPLRPSRLLPSLRPVQGYLRQRVDPLTSLFLVLPLFLIYHVGVLAMLRVTDHGYEWVGNGVDYLTGTLLALSGGRPLVYAGIALAVTAVLCAAILRARRHAQLHPRAFIPVLGESAVYAYLMAATIGWIISRVGLGIFDNEDWAVQVIASCGAGLHEELIFRAGLFGGMSYLLVRRMRPWKALCIAGFVSTFVFTAAHYVGPLGDRFTLDSFSFRFLCGVAFAVIYRVRGFALAAWTHTLYDVLYYTLKHV